MKFTQLNIYAMYILFYVQTIINDILIKDSIDTDFLLCTYNCIFALSYCAIITKVLYSYCNIIWHMLTIAFLYTYNYLDMNNQLLYSYKYLFHKFMSITVWHGVSVKYNYLTSLKPIFTLSCIYNILENSKIYFVDILSNYIENKNLIHMSCFLNIILSLFNFKIIHINHSNTLFFDLFSKKFIVLFVFVLSYKIIVNCDSLENTSYIGVYIILFIIKMYINTCAHKKFITGIIYSLPVFMIISKLFLKSYIYLNSITNSVQLPIMYLVCMQYNSNGFIYSLNIITIILPSIVDLIIRKHILWNMLIILLSISLYYVYEIIQLNIKKEIINNEENSIKNNIDIIINE